MSFPEEPLDLSPTSGGPGYFATTIGQKLNNDKYEIIRKLGYGPRSSTWLIWREYDDIYFSVKIYTVAESKRAEEVELPILRSVKNLNSNLPLPWYQDSFRETGYHGSHFCIVTNPLSTTVEDLRLGEEAKKLPVHVVQRIIYCTALALEGLHSAEIMHGGMFAAVFLHQMSVPDTIVCISRQCGKCLFYDRNSGRCLKASTRRGRGANKHPGREF